MINKIINLVKQMGEDDKEHLFQRIQREYCLEEKTGMLRDDIRDKITALFEIAYYITLTEPPKEQDTFEELGLSSTDIQDFMFCFVLQEFNLESIEFAQIMEWQSVKDIVDYIEATLENKGE